MVNGLLPLDRPGQGSARSGTLEAGTSLGKRGSQLPGSRSGATGAGDSCLQKGVGEQAANGAREVGSSVVVLCQWCVEQKREDALRTAAKVKVAGGTGGVTTLVSLVTESLGKAT